MQRIISASSETPHRLCLFVYRPTYVQYYSACLCVCVCVCVLSVIYVTRISFSLYTFMFSISEDIDIIIYKERY